MLWSLGDDIVEGLGVYLTPKVGEEMLWFRIGDIVGHEKENRKYPSKWILMPK